MCGGIKSRRRTSNDLEIEAGEAASKQDERWEYGIWRLCCHPLRPCGHHAVAPVFCVEAPRRLIIGRCMWVRDRGRVLRVARSHRNIPSRQIETIFTTTPRLLYTLASTL